MSKLAEFRALEKALQEQLAALECIKSDSALQLELEFEEKLKALMAEYGATLGTVIAILDPESALKSSSQRVDDGVPRKARKLKIYSNPHNGEVIETKGGNHKLLKEWKAKWGSEVVESWETGRTEG